MRTPAGPELVLAGCVLVASAVTVVVLAASPSMPAGAVALHAAGVAVPIALGLYCWARRNTPLAIPLVIAGLLGVVITLAESRHSVPYSFGRIGAWLLE